ncbi:hypothetical protein KAR91_05100 [Candidatus Pacearchaeota archaeon]|nr:hypothetical protein [Candidatus Pacearchaeota archaeon]
MEGENNMDYNKMADSIAEKILKKLNNRGENNMENVSRTNIDDFLTVRGFGGYGYGGGGYGGGGYGGHGGILREDAHADGTGRGENIKCNRDVIRDGHTFLSREHQDIVRNDQFAETSRQISGLQGSIADAKAEAARCCCEAKTLTLETKADLTNLINGATIESLKSDKSDAHNTAVLNALTQMSNAIAALAANSNSHGGH